MAATTSHVSLFPSNCSVFWTEEDRTCGNCAHWMEHQGLPLRHGVMYAPCALDGKDVCLSDAPGAASFMSPHGNCRDYGDGWEPAEAYLEELSYAEDARQADRRPFYGMAEVLA